MTDWGRTEWDPSEDERPEWEQDGWDSEDPYGDDLYGDGSYGADDDGYETVRCSGCGKDVYEESPQCPYCGHFITRSRSPLAGRPSWYVICAVIGVLVTVLVLATGGFSF